MKELKCLDCNQIYLLEKYEDRSLVVGPLHCPFCGGTNVRTSNVDRYWYDLSESLGFGRSADGAHLTHELYKLWEPSEHSRFRDFVEVCKKTNLEGVVL